MNWEFITEANLQLTETEHRYYGDIFLYCCEHSDNDSVPVVKAAELLRSANLPRDVTVKVNLASDESQSSCWRLNFFLLMCPVVSCIAVVSLSDVQSENEIVRAKDSLSGFCRESHR